MSKKAIILLTVTIALAGVGVGVYFWYDNQQKQKKLLELQKDHTLVDKMPLDEVIALLITKGEDLSGINLTASNESVLKTMLKGALNKVIK